MQCSVYASTRREHLYLYIRDGLEFDDIPDELAKSFGEPRFVIDLELSPQRPLAQEDVTQVIENLSGQGFHLQLPPGEDHGDLP